MQIVEGAVGHDEENVLWPDLRKDEPEHGLHVEEVVGFLAAGGDVLDELSGGEPLFRGDALHVGRLLDEDDISGVEGAGILLLEDLPTTRVGPGLEDGPEPPAAVEGPERLDGHLNRGRMVSEVVDDGDPAGLAAHLLAAPYALEGRERLLDALNSHPELPRQGDEAERVAEVVGSGEGRGEPGLEALRTLHPETGCTNGVFGVRRLELSGVSEAVGDDSAAGLPAEAGGAGIIGIHHEEAVRGDDGEEPAEGVLHRFEIGKNVGVVELDTREHDRPGLIVKELRSLVKEGGVILVSLNDEVGPAPQAMTLTKVDHDAADEAARIQPGHGEHPGEKRRGGGLAVGPGHNERLRRVQKEPAQGLGHGTVGEAPVEHGLGFRVVSPDDVSHHHEIGRRFQVVGAIALDEVDVLRGQEGAHGRVDVLVGSSDVVARLLEHGGQRSHARATDAHEVDGMNGVIDGWLKRRVHGSYSALPPEAKGSRCKA